MLAAIDDTHFGNGLLRRHNLTSESMETAIKDIRGSNRVSGALTHLFSLPTNSHPMQGGRSTLTTPSR